MTAPPRFPFSGALFLLGFLALAFIFRDAIGLMLASWQQDEYSHGYFIPVLSLLLILNKATQIKQTPYASWFGAAIVGLALTTHIAFECAGVEGVVAQIYVIALIGLMYLFWGRAVLWSLAGPLTLLFFCAPLPKLLFYTLSFDMQMMSSSFGTRTLMLLGIPVFQDGNIIDLGGYKLQVAEACSGLRYLFPLLGLSFLLAILYKVAFWKRAVLFFSALPISIVMNGLRIALIGITVDRWGPAMAEGLLHEFEGLVIFAGCFGLLLAEIGLLNRIGVRGALRLDALGWPSFRHFPAPALGKPVLAGAGILVVGVVISIFLPPFLAGYLKPVPLRQPLSSFPLQIGPWAGTAKTMDARAQDILGTTQYFIGDFAKADTPPVNLYILYYPQQDSLSNQGLHSPSVCVPGGGWTIEQKSVQYLPLSTVLALTVNRMLIAKDGVREIVYYWFNQDGTALWSPNLSKFLQMKNAVTKGRSDGAMIRLVTAVGASESEVDGEQRLRGYLDAVLPTVDHFLFPVNLEQTVQPSDDRGNP